MDQKHLTVGESECSGVLIENPLRAIQLTGADRPDGDARNRLGR
jgi:hypothetical protein